MSKPVGTFSKERNCIFWQLGDVVLNAAGGGGVQKLLARFITEGSEGRQGKVEARWDVHGEGAGALGSGLGISVRGGDGGEDDPFSDDEAKEGNWKSVQGIRKVTAGTYQAL